MRVDFSHVIRERCMPVQEKQGEMSVSLPNCAKTVRDGRKVSRQGNRFSVSTGEGLAGDCRENGPDNVDKFPWYG